MRVLVLGLLPACAGSVDPGDTGVPDAPPPLSDGAAVRGDGGDLAGSALAAADLDGDGEVDLVVGALGGRVACAVYAPFSGDTPLRAGPCLTQEADYDFLGQAVAAGDLDGDGVGDVLLGGPGSDAAAADAGRAWRVPGGAFPDGSGADTSGAATSVATAATVVWTGASAGDQAGATVAALGDVDGDGAPDVAIGAPGSDLGGREGGALYVVGGDTGGSLAEAPVVIVGGSGTSAAKHAENVLGDGVGAAACGADLDGDGIADVAVGVPGWDAGADNARADNAGAVAVWRGPVAAGTWAVADADVVLASDRAGGYLGGALACGGDTDGDGVAEVLAGADADGGGRVYLLRGLALDGAVVFEGAAPGAGGGEQAGYAVAFVGDAVAIGAASADTPVTDAGGVAVFTRALAAGTYTLADADARWAGVGAGDLAGTALAGLVGADGSALLAVGAPYDRATAPVGGAAYVVPVP